MSAELIRIRKTGAKSYPWEVRCPRCRDPRTHFHPLTGAIAVNTRGIGNRTWFLAMLGAILHIKAHEEVDNDTA
jgi:hypothetical protein